MSTKLSAQKFYDNFASNYDSTVNGSKVSAQNVTEAAKIFHKYNRGGIKGNVLDLGCGTGLLKDSLQGELEYTGVDVSSHMLDYASKRGYKVIHKSIEDTLPEISNSSYDFEYALSSLQFVRDIHLCLRHINRIARQSIILSIDDLTAEFLSRSQMECYNYSQMAIANIKEDYFIKGWTSPTMGITIRTRMIYIANPFDL